MDGTLELVERQRKEIAILVRTTEILAAQVATFKGESDWAAIQNAAHSQATQETQ